MAITQKYKQQQQQVRVQTSENNYLKGMYFSDVPLAEGYSRVLVNFDINSLSGALTPMSLSAFLRVIWLALHKARREAETSKLSLSITLHSV